MPGVGGQSVSQSVSRSGGGSRRRCKPPLVSHRSTRACWGGSVSSLWFPSSPSPWGGRRPCQPTMTTTRSQSTYLLHPSVALQRLGHARLVQHWQDAAVDQHGQRVVGAVWCGLHAILVGSSRRCCHDVRVSGRVRSSDGWGQWSMRCSALGSYTPVELR
jgi:hypothetical protein